jgi:hypothetical protein
MPRFRIPRRRPRPYYQVPANYTDRQLMESIWRRIDGLAIMLAGPIRDARREAPDAHPDDIAEMVAAWTLTRPTHNPEEKT